MAGVIFSGELYSWRLDITFLVSSRPDHYTCAGLSCSLDLSNCRETCAQNLTQFCDKQVKVRCKTEVTVGIMTFRIIKLTC